jgi:hypothetical protein
MHPQRELLRGTVGVASAWAVIIATLLVKRIIKLGGQTTRDYGGEQLREK